MLKKILAISCAILCVSCPAHQGISVFFSNKHERIYKRSACESNRPFPQMVMIPFFKNATQLVPNCATYPKHKTALALMIFYHNWLRWFDDDDLAVRDALEKVMVQWGTEKRRIKKGYNLKGEEAEYGLATGITLSSSVIWVWQGHFHKISESSLMHELVHIALRAQIGHGDSDHEGNKFDGWTISHSAMILEANEMLRDFDI